ncbi:hypothetical protein FZC75_10420 [Sutcliffiella horikoshii]|uniref:Uncharacterized protein n=2 Tax=Sutcliffiella horikoshii TaxID=79883 RepID=A0A5D4T9J2_9BACI|nr:hypothetical protein FZC75_10420 [Sutcliffiella horikoshii]
MLLITVLIFTCNSAYAVNQSTYVAVVDVKEFNNLKLEIYELQSKIENLTNENAELSKERQQMKTDIQILENENTNVIKAIESNFNTVSMLITIVGIIIGLGAIIVTVFSFKAVSKFINYKFNSKVETAFNDRFEDIKTNLYKKVDEKIEDRASGKLEEWDKKFTALFKVAKR